MGNYSDPYLNPVNSGGPVSNAIVRGVKIAVYILVTTTWIFLGFFLWIPLLFRMIGTYTAAIVASVFTAYDTSNAERGVHYASWFYIRGFQIAQKILGEEPILKSVPPLATDKLGSLVFNILYSLLFWIFAYSIWAVLFKGWNYLLSIFNYGYYKVTR